MQQGIAEAVIFRKPPSLSIATGWQLEPAGMPASELKAGRHRMQEKVRFPPYPPKTDVMMHLARSSKLDWVRPSAKPGTNGGYGPFSASHLGDLV